MDKIMDIALSNWAICCYEAVILGFVFVYFIRLRKEKKEAVEMNVLQKEKAREEKLDQILRNRLYQGGDKAVPNNIPYEIDFHEEAGISRGTDENIAVRIVEKGKLSTRKYVIFISDEITIGQSAKNGLVLNDLKVAKEQCRIFKHEQNLYIQTLEDIHPVTIHRKRSTVQLTKNAVNLLDGDCIELGETILNIHFI